MRPCHLSEWHQKVAHSTGRPGAEAPSRSISSYGNVPTHHGQAVRVHCYTLKSQCASYVLLRQNPQGLVRVGDDGLTRERDEHCHDLSAWD